MESTTNSPLRHVMSLLNVQDVALITGSAAGGDLTFSVYTTEGSRLELVDRKEYDRQRIQACKAVVNARQACQAVVLVHESGIDFITRADGTITVTRRDFDAKGVRAIAGPDPYSREDVPGSGEGVWLIDVDAKGPLAMMVNAVSGTILRHFLTGIEGQILAAEIGANGLDSYFFVLADVNGRLAAYATKVPAVGDLETPLKCQRLDLGPLDPQYGVTSIPVNLVAGPNRQIAMTYVDSDGAGRLAAIHVDNSGLLKTLAAIRLNTEEFATPSTRRFRIAAGPLWKAEGSDSSTFGTPIVVGYAGRFGAADGCACLMLFEYDSRSARLLQTSTYAVAADDGSSIASNDLHIGAGIFGLGEQLEMGVLVLGDGASLKQLTKNLSAVRAFVVGIDQNLHTFPIQDSSHGPQRVAAKQVMELKPESIFVGLGVDMTGRSLMLGPPKLTTRSQSKQILAILQAPPFEAELVATRPTLTFNKHQESGKTYNVNSNKAVGISKDFGFHFNLGPISIGVVRNEATSRGLDKISDKVNSTSVQISSEISQIDLLLVYGMDYLCWEYPTLQGGKLGGSVLVVIPNSERPNLEIVTAHDDLYGYIQQHENGSLLTYLDYDLDRLGYKPANEIFEVSAEIGPTDDESGATTLLLDQNNMSSSTESLTSSLHQSVSDSAGFTGSTQLFDFLPVGFGLNLQTTSSFSDSKVDTTTLSNTETLGLTFTAGMMKRLGGDPHYRFRPLVYYHDKLGCLMVSYKVTIGESFWQNYHPTPRIKLMSVHPFDKDDVLRAFSRSISFRKPQGGSKTEIEIVVEVFNNSVVSSRDIVVEIFIGSNKPLKATPKADDRYDGWDFGSENPAPPPRQELQEMKPTERRKLSFRAALEDGDYVAVFVGSKESAKGACYWNQYPRWAGQ